MQLLNKRREGRDEEGFTLIELMVVVLIIAILIAIAIPTFLGARSRAQDKASQSNLRNGITSAKTIFTDKQDYTDATPTALVQVEPSLAFQNASTASTQPKEVSVEYGDADATVAGQDTIYMASKSKSGKCYASKDVQSSAGAGTTYTEITSGACSGANAKSGSWTWSDSF